MSSETAEAGAPQTVWFARVKQRLEKLPFVPFRIVTTSGRGYDVPTADHAVLFPLLRLIIVADDHGGSTDIHALHVAAIEPLTRRRQRSAKAA